MGVSAAVGAATIRCVEREEWLLRRTYRGADFDPERLADRAREQGVSVSVCLPALDVADTVGEIVTAVRERLVRDVPLVSEIVVVDSRSSDRTRAVAAEAGARVVEDREVLPRLAPGRGKGEAMWKSLAVLSGDLVVWLDSDVVDFDPAFVTGLLGPLLDDPEVGYVKAVYRRRLGGEADGGGRVTEICARPLINIFYPELAGFAQPLSGEAAGRRELLSSVPFFGGYAVELGLLIDLLRSAGLGALAQVDLGERRHHNQPTAALGAMASTITQAVLRRVADEGRAPDHLAGPGLYVRPGRGPDDAMAFTVLDTRPEERPPMSDVLRASAA
jgi:glucosyl-3-phosphoglycerate synthase